VSGPDGGEGRPLIYSKSGPQGLPVNRTPRQSFVASPNLQQLLTKFFNPRSGTARMVLAASVSIGWMVFSSMLILLNKYILKDLKFP